MMLHVQAPNCRHDRIYISSPGLTPQTFPTEQTSFNKGIGLTTPEMATNLPGLDIVPKVRSFRVSSPLLTSFITLATCLEGVCPK